MSDKLYNAAPQGAYFTIQGEAHLRPIGDFPGYYVGSDGSVWTQWRQEMRGGREGSVTVLGDSVRRLKPDIRKSGYQLVVLRRDKKSHGRLVHRLVLEAFSGPCPEGMEACHGEEGLSSNHIENLRWDTHQSNMDEMVRSGHQARGERHHLRRLTEAQVVQLRRDYQKDRPSFASLARRYGVTAHTVRSAIMRKTWGHLP